jgi:hypothetical protein
MTVPMPEADGARHGSGEVKPRVRRASKWRLTFRDATEVGRHTVAFIAAIISIWIVHFVLERLLGGDAKFYDKIPVRYVIDTGHLAVLTRYIWQLILEIGRKP